MFRSCSLAGVDCSYMYCSPFQHGSTSDGKAWNDLNNEGLVNGYVIEFDADVPRVPEPTILMLLAGGFLGLGLARRR